MSKTVHIVCLDCPSPPDYGGAIDMFYKIKALSEIGVAVILHYFDYHPSRKRGEIAPYCARIFSYKRKPFLQALPLSHPFIVQSRINQVLIDRLNEDEYPVLLEGLHCSGIIPFLRNKERVIVRMHNNEAAYYHHLSCTEKSLAKRLYFRHESRLLKNYQQRLDKNSKLAFLSITDREDFAAMGFTNHFFLPCFLPWQGVKSATGFGEYCLYHGNLSISENEQAATWLVEAVFSHLQIPLVIAGRNISKKLFALAKKYPHVTLVDNPPADELAALLRDAHLHVLPSMNSTGVKLKLLNALLNGRYCLTNRNGEAGSDLEPHVIVKENVADWIIAIPKLMQEEFSATIAEKRKGILAVYNNRQNASLLSEQW